MPDDLAIAQFISKRAFQLRILIEGHFLSQGLACNIEVIEGDFGDLGANSWLFTPGYQFSGGEIGTFYLTVRGHISRLESHDPSEVAKWIMDDTDYTARLSQNGDIVAYRDGQAANAVIAQILAICNSADLPY